METDINLSVKEIRIIKLIAAGESSTQIADRMCISLPTVKWYRKRLRAKFGTTTTVEMVLKARDEGFL